MRSTGCGKNRCEICVNVCETDTFSCKVAGKTFKINLKLNSDDKWLIYLFKCECRGKQYEQPLGSLILKRITINVMIGNVLGMRIVFRNIYLDIAEVGNIQVSLKMSRSR